MDKFFPVFSLTKRPSVSDTACLGNHCAPVTSEQTGMNGGSGRGSSMSDSKGGEEGERDAEKDKKMEKRQLEELGGERRRVSGLEEVMPLETCGATQATSPNENIEEMVKNSDCTESYMKTTGPVLSPLSRAEKHCLRIATVSSLDRCVSCVGPVSSFKWLGYECRECSQVWHKSCFRKIQDDNLHYLPKLPFQKENSFRDELQSNQSDSEKDQISDECMSDEEYIPDSQGDDDDYSDASIPLMPSQSKAGRIQFETLTDVGKNYPSDTSLPVLAMH
nr:uncharacterized protein LOC117460706 [Pseudochaenichthys georgianus]